MNVNDIKKFEIVMFFNLIKKEEVYFFYLWLWNWYIKYINKFFNFGIKVFLAKDYYVY